jgi:hypothetical protein
VRLLPWTISDKRTRFFMWSHTIGWIIAWLQTVWIIFEIRRNTRLTKEILKRGRN